MWQWLKKHTRSLKPAGVWIRDHVVVVLAVTALGAWMVHAYQRPELSFARAMASVRWETYVEGDSVIAETDMWDMWTGRPLVRQTIVGDIGALVPLAPEYGVIIKILVNNSGKSPVSDLRIPVEVDTGRKGSVSSTPNVSADLIREGLGGLVQVIHVPVVPPKTKAVITYEFKIDSRAVSRIMREGLRFAFASPVSRELGHEYRRDGVKPFAAMLAEEQALRTDGATFPGPHFTPTHRGRPLPKPVADFMRDTTSAQYRRMRTTPHLTVR